MYFYNSVLFNLLADHSAFQKFSVVAEEQWLSLGPLAQTRKFFALDLGPCRRPSGRLQLQRGGQAGLPAYVPLIGVTSIPSCERLATGAAGEGQALLVSSRHPDLYLFAFQNP